MEHVSMSLLQALTAPAAGEWNVVVAALVAVSGFYLSRTVTTLDRVTDKVVEHGEEIAVHRTEISNLKDKLKEGDA